MKETVLSCVNEAIENGEGQRVNNDLFRVDTFRCVVHKGKVKWRELKARDCSKEIVQN